MPEHLRLIVLLATWCQLRRAELLGLRRKDIDLARRHPSHRTESNHNNARKITRQGAQDGCRPAHDRRPRLPRRATERVTSVALLAPTLMLSFSRGSPAYHSRGTSCRWPGSAHAPWSAARTSACTICDNWPDFGSCHWCDDGGTHASCRTLVVCRCDALPARNEGPRSHNRGRTRRDRAPDRSKNHRRNSLAEKVHDVHDPSCCDQFSSF